MAQFTPVQLVSASNATYTSNNANQITAQIVRSLNDNWISSSALVNNSNAFTGSQVISGSANILGPLTSSLAATINGLYVGRGRSQTISNTVLGENAYQGPDGGTNNTAIGFGALTVASGSIRNTAIGAGVLAAAVDDTNNNTAVGYQALNKLDGGVRNTAVGVDALFSSVATDANTAIGFGAGINSVNGDQNVYVGFEAGAENEGDYNTFIGAEAGEKLASGNSNILIGRRVAFDMVSGSNNIIIGGSSGGFISGSQNVIIGSAPSNSSSFSNNIIISDGQGDIRARYIYIDNVSGSWVLDGSLQVTGSAGDLIVHDHKQFHGAEFWSTTTQSGSAGVSGSFTFNNTGVAYGASVVSNSRLTIANAGVYNIQFSAQIDTTAGADTVYVWFKKNGSNIAASNTKAVLDNNTAQVMTVNILDEANANDYYEIAYQTASGNATIKAETATGNLPAIPSIIATVTQVR